MSYKEYTQAQKDAIAWNDGPLIVLAGPGAGKTDVLTERVIRLLKESISGSYRILALTFTNKAAMEMNERIMNECANQEKRLFIGTFHSFCLEVLRNHGSYINLKSNFEIFSSTNDLNAVIDDIKKEYKNLNPISDFDDLRLLNVIQFFEKKLCITEEDLDNAMPKSNYQGLFKSVYLRYLEKMLELNALDFDMLILLTYKLFAKYPNIARIYRSMYKYINIDEFQDTNYGQYELIKLLCGQKYNNIFVVADDDQVIYGWNGASYKRLKEFRHDFGADVIQLYQNFRCPKEVVKIANKLIAHNSSRIENKKAIIAMKEIEDLEKKQVFVKEFNDFEQELNGILKVIQKIKYKYPNESVCVLSRTSRLLDRAYEVALENNIKCVRPKRKDEFEMPYVLLIYDMLKLANHRDDKKTLIQIITLIETITDKKVNYENIILQANMVDGDLLKALSSNIDGVFNNELEKSIRLNLCEGKDFLKYINDAFLWSDNQINKIVKTENKEQLKYEYDSEKNVWFNFQNNFNSNCNEQTVSSFMQEFAIISKENEPEDDCVQYLTIHASKGKEFDNVFIIGMVNDELPSFQSLKKGLNSLELEEERRNCFVAITRTKKRLFLTYSNFYFCWRKSISQFLLEMFDDIN